MDTLWIKPGSWFIKYEDLRLHCNDSCNRDTFFLTPAQMMRYAFSKFFYAHNFQGFMNTVVDSLFVQSKVGRTDCDVLFDSRGKDLVISILEYDSYKFSHLTDVGFGDR